MHRTTVALPDELAELLARQARQREMSVSALVRRLIEEGLAGPGDAPRPLPWADLFDDPGMVAAGQEEEALAESWADDLDRNRR